jgi:hypothetical protein
VNFRPQQSVIGLSGPTGSLTGAQELAHDGNGFLAESCFRLRITASAEECSVCLRTIVVHRLETPGKELQGLLNLRVVANRTVRGRCGRLRLVRLPS